nr:MAG TPA: hypothetical protein [Microviridae sp.]
MSIVRSPKCLLMTLVLMLVVWLILKMCFMSVFIKRCINMYKGVLKFIKRETFQEEFIINIGIFNRPSTAERFRKQLQDANIGYDVLLILEKL